MAWIVNCITTNIDTGINIIWAVSNIDKFWSYDLMISPSINVRFCPEINERNSNKNLKLPTAKIYSSCINKKPHEWGNDVVERVIYLAAPSSWSS